MPKPIVRIGDSWVGTCSNHQGPPRPVSGVVGNPPQTLVFDEGRLAAVIGTPCPSNCGHTGILMASSILTNVEGKKIGLLGDRVQGQGINGIVVAGSSLTNSD